MDLLRALSRASNRALYLPITFDVTSRTEPFRGSERVISGGLVATGDGGNVLANVYGLHESR